jgi:SAM-dependent methyltransferase
MTSQFSDAYSNAYDLLYAGKKYEEEALYLAAKVRGACPQAKSILELGSGTGRHARLMCDQGFEVVGIERSQGMLDKARKTPHESLTYIEGDIRTCEAGRRFDAVVSLFHVVSYLTSNDDILAAFGNARRHLDRGGVFAFDFWYGPAVLTCKPENRHLELTSDALEITRFAQTKLDYNRNVASVAYTLFVRDLASNTLIKENESHAMRYLFLPELDMLLKLAGFDLLLAEEWMTSQDLGSTTWNGFVVCKAI